MDGKTAATISTPGSHDGRAVTETVVNAVADAADVSPLDLPPLTTAIDSDALETLFRDDSATRTVVFTDRGYRVRATGDGSVTLGDTDIS